MVPRGYEAHIFPHPTAAREGLIAVAEPYLNNGRSHASATTVILEAVTNRIGSVYWKANDYMYLPRGYPLAIMKFIKQE